MTQINDRPWRQVKDLGAGWENAMKSPVAAIMAVCVVLAPQVGRAESTAPAPESYVDACEACHGPGARGDGPKAALLSEAVPDLTTFAKRNDGVFDKARVVRLIDGREGLAAHEGPMPMFGGLLTGTSVVIDGPEGSPVSTTQPILAIVEWLESVQAE